MAKEEEQELENTFVLTDEEGLEYTFELLDFVDYEEKLYAILAPVEEADSEEVGIVIMETKFEGEDPSFTNVEDDDLCQVILDLFVSKLDEEDDQADDAE